MQGYEIDAFIENEIKARWTQWKPTDKQLSDWRYLLSKISKEIATDAILRTRTQSQRILSPVIGEFNKHISDCIQERAKAKAAEQGGSKGGEKIQSFINCYLVISFLSEYRKPPMGRGVFEGRKFEVALSPRRDYLDEDGELDCGHITNALKKHKEYLQEHCCRDGQYMECEFFIGDESHGPAMKRANELENAFFKRLEAAEDESGSENKPEPSGGFGLDMSKSPF